MKRHLATPRWLRALCAVAVVGTTACGGGGGGGGTVTGAGPGSTGGDAGVASEPPADSAAAQPPSVTTPEPVQQSQADAGWTGGGAPVIGGCEMFPPAAIFNTRIDDPSRFPVHPRSADWIGAVGAGTALHADWGTHGDPAQTSTYWGLPYNVVGTGGTDWPQLSYDFGPSGTSAQQGWPHEGDCAVADAGGHSLVRGCSELPADERRFPFPPAASVKNENGHCSDPNACGDRHVLVVEQGACRLWEAYSAYHLGGRWYAMATAAWDLGSLALRPQGWTSGDAAGLPITPLLAKVDEASAGEIRHALRVTFRDAAIAREFEWPARHAAGGDNPGAIPFGALLRLRADFPIPDHWTAQAKALATAMKRYGMYVSDNGADFHVQGEPSGDWDLDTLVQLRAVSMADMEFVSMERLKADPRWRPDSMAARW